MATWTDIKTKLAAQAKTANTAVLAQLYEDWNTGYRMFNAKVARYYNRKQAFTSLVADQSIYQTPIDSVRMIAAVVTINTGMSMPVRVVRSEEEWRIIKSTTTSSNWPTHCFVLGDDLIELYPTPSTTVASGFRFVYQPLVTDLSISDVTAGTVTAANGSVTITHSGTGFNTGMGSLWFQVTGLANPYWYEIVSATTSVLTLKSPYVGVGASGLSYRVGQRSIVPSQYEDAPIHYALGMFYSANGNETRAQYHLGTAKKPGMFYQMIEDCEAEYSSSDPNSVMIEEDGVVNNPWFITPGAA